MLVAIRLDEKDTTLLRKYAKLNNMTVSELVRQSVKERIEDELDRESYQKAIAEHNRNSVVYSHDEVRELLVL